MRMICSWQPLRLCKDGELVSTVHRSPVDLKTMAGSRDEGAIRTEQLLVMRVVLTFYVHTL